MLYTVKEMAQLANVTIKALHHYHKIGILPPCEVSEAGYRLYGTKELERLQHILFYKELDFPLETIKRLLADNPQRLSILSEQKQLLAARKRRLEKLMETLDASIASAAKGEVMDQKEMFAGFQTEEQWKEALAEQSRYVNDTYGYDMLVDNPIDVDALNEQAQEAVRFMNGMAAALREGARHDSERVRQLIRGHLESPPDGGSATSAADFAGQARFFLNDDFHRDMLESQQTGLAYYLYAAAEAYAAGPAPAN